MAVEFEEAEPAKELGILFPELFRTNAELMEAEGDGVKASISREHEHMARELGRGGWLDGTPYCLTHLDLHPRNIIVDPSPNDWEIIMGILGWEHALFAPAFVACKPPQWLWQTRSSTDDGFADNEQDESTANDEPPTLEAREVKEIFEGYAGPLYVWYAYQLAYRIARRLFRFITNRMTDSQDFKDSDALLDEWKAFCDRSFIAVGRTKDLVIRDWASTHGPGRGLDD